MADIEDLIRDQVFLRPHPDPTCMTREEILKAIAEAEKEQATAKKSGDKLAEAYFSQEITLLSAELARRNGSAHHNSCSGNGADLLSLPQPAKPTLAPEALQGLAGEIVKAIEPFTESDPVATLTNILAAFGNVVGPYPYFRVEHSRHYLNIFVAQVGETSKGRKGTAWSAPKKMLADIDPEWAENRVTGGLSSGEGLIYAVRDKRYEKRPVREKGRVVDYESVLVDEGVGDKRLMLIEEELAQALKVMAREGNILSATVRQAWDHVNLSPLTKSSPIRATNAHISIVGHITRDELLRYLTETEQANGFANRFIWLMVYRSKCIANPTGVPDEILSPLVEKLRDRVKTSQSVMEMVRSHEAAKVWAGVYPKLSEGKPGLLGSVIGRAEAQVMRLACLYALLDGHEVVGIDHLNAALALWDYSEQSARAIFGDLTGDPTADRIGAALKGVPDGVSETDIRDLFGRHKSSNEIDRGLVKLQAQSKIKAETVTTSGRPKTIWRWCDKSDKSDQR